MLAWAALPRARISAKEPFFGGALAGAAAGDDDADEAAGLSLLGVGAARDAEADGLPPAVPVYRWLLLDEGLSVDGRDAGIDLCGGGVTRFVLVALLWRSELAFLLMLVDAAERLGAGSLLAPPLIWASKSLIWMG